MTTQTTEAIEQRDADRIIFSDKELQTFSKTAAELARKAAQRVVLKTAIWKVASDLEAALAHLSYEEVARELSESIKATVKPKTLRRYMKLWRIEQEAKTDSAQTAQIPAGDSAPLEVTSSAEPSITTAEAADLPTSEALATDSIPAIAENAPVPIESSADDASITSASSAPLKADQTAALSQTQPDASITTAGIRTVRRTTPPIASGQPESVQPVPTSVNGSNLTTPRLLDQSSSPLQA